MSRELTLASLLDWRLLLSIATSIALLALLLGMIAASGTRLNLSVLLASLQHMPMQLVMAYVVLQLLGAVFRAWRYQLLIRTSDPAVQLPFRAIYIVTIVRNMLADMLPARLGELVFIGMLNRGYRVRADACVAAMSLSILLDVAIVVPVLLLLAVTPLAIGLQGAGLAMPAVLILAAVAVALLLLFPGLHWLAHRLHPRLTGSRSAMIRRLLGFLTDLANAFDRIRRGRIATPALLLTAGVRLTKYASFYCLFIGATAVVLPSLGDLPAWQIVATLIASEAAASLPLPTFMSFGSYEAGGMVSLTTLGYPAFESLVALLSMHITSQVVDYLLGAIAFTAFLLTTGHDARAEKITTRGRIARLAGLVAIAAALAFAYTEYRALQLNRSLVPPPAGQAVSAPDEQQRASTATRGLRGFVVWSSNRFGNHDILRLSLPDLRVSRLTSNPHTEYYPRISPDGRRIVFARSQRPWVSQRDPVPWDVYLLDLESGEERLLARNANVPTWSADGETVYFQRDIGQFVELELATGTERVMFHSGAGGIAPGVELQTPHYSAARRQLAATFRRAQRQTVLVNLDDGLKRQVGQGCQLAWSPGSDYLYWIDNGGRQSNLVRRFEPASDRREDWLDLPEPYSHEYFPKVSNDGRYLVLGASAGGHEHDSADYELFLWQIGDEPTAAVRLTYHSGNDNWPDIYLER